MTADRDRLAADLHAMKSSLFCWSREGKVSSACRPNAVRHQQQADRLIALGWTRLDEERLALAYHLIAVEEMHDPPEGCAHTKRAVPACIAGARRTLAAIAKAHREDAG